MAGTEINNPAIPFISPDEQRKRFDFQYSQAFSLTAAGTAGADQQINIKTLSDSWFVMQTIMSSESVAGSLHAMRMRDDGTGKIWQSDYVSTILCSGVA